MNSKEYISEIIEISKKIYDNSNETKDEITELKKYPHLFVLKCIMDRQINENRAWEIPYKV